MFLEKSKGGMKKTATGKINNAEKFPEGEYDLPDSLQAIIRVPW